MIIQKNSDYKKFGQDGEELVAKFLVKKGFEIRATNYRQNFGEIDLIASKDDLIIFVEVKSRKFSYFNLSEVITFSKQQKIIKTAKYFIMQNKLAEKIFRFDVALVEEKNNNFKINYIPNAFCETNF